MRIVRLDSLHSARAEKTVEKSVAILREGGVIMYPTDTVYGLGANALDEQAIEKVFLIKERVKQKPISVAVRDVAMARRIAVISPIAEKFLARVWPGAVTVILPKRSVVPDMLTDGGPIGLRCFKNAFLEKLFLYIDFPLTATSANISGELPISNIKALRAQLKNKKYIPDLIIDAGALPPSSASTIIDLTGNEPKIVRVGPTSPQELIRLFNDLKKQ